MYPASALSTRRLTRCAVLTALALALSVTEGLFPLTVLVPLPGLRLGLANLVTIYALCTMSGREALLILVARCLLGALVGGNLSALAFSLGGGLLAFGVMWLLVRCPQHRPGPGRHGRAGLSRPAGLPGSPTAGLPGHRSRHRRGLHSAGPKGPTPRRKTLIFLSFLCDACYRPFPVR